MMSTFTKCAATATTGSCDPTKHVNYNLGMVLGVDDFNQEFTYLSGRDQWIARDLIGYGTATGLRVASELDVKGPRVIVAPGVAVSPCGQMIRVPTAQCAYLNDFLKLDKTKQELAKRNVASPGALRLYVVLCYRDCPTDDVPIPGEPCRSEDDLMAASRLADDFALELRFDPPDQTEENAVRDFVLWLSQVEFSDALPSTPMDEFLRAIRESSEVISSPPDFMFGSPPESLVINRADVCRYLGAAYRIWVTELRPKWRPDLLSNWKGCCGESEGDDVPQEECVLLAEVDVPVLIPGGGGDWQVEDPAKITLNEDNRPYLVHLRMLQEWLLCGRSSSGSDLAGDVTGPATDTTVERIRRVNVANTPPALNQVLMFSGVEWQPSNLPPAPAPSNTVQAEVTFGVASAAGNSAQFSRANHTHGTPPDPIPPHKADAAAHNLLGDVTGTTGSSTVARIQNIPVIVAPPPANGQVLTFRGNQWRAEALSVVEHPPGLPQYLIVAAGLVSGDPAAPPSLVYNKLQVTAVVDGQITVLFTDYKPAAGTQYIVKALPVFNDNARKLTVYFGAFLAAGVGFTLRIFNDGVVVPAVQIRALSFMIEVSQYF